jgi:hypothetical protein
MGHTTARRPSWAFLAEKHQVFSLAATNETSHALKLFLS